MKNYQLNLFNKLKKSILNEIIALWANEFKKFEVRFLSDTCEILLNNEIRIIGYSNNKIYFNKRTYLTRKSDLDPVLNEVQFYLDDDDVKLINDYRKDIEKVFEILDENAKFLSLLDFEINDTNKTSYLEAIEDYVEENKKEFELISNTELFGE